MSKRASKSPYATKGQRNTHTSTQSRRQRSSTVTEASTVTHRTSTGQHTTPSSTTESQDGITTIYQRAAPEEVAHSSNFSSRPGMDQGQLRQVADTVTAQLIPELRGQIENVISSMRSSPPAAESPDSVSQTVTQGTIFNANNDVLTQVASINEQLGTNVSQNLREKIINGDYVDLGSLLINSENHEQTKSISISGNGQLVLQSRPGKKINDINVWIEAFLIYSSIYTSVHTESIQGLLKYMYTIKIGANRSNGQGWREYDQQFRLKKAKHPALPWGVVDQELWLLYVHSVQNMLSQPNVTVSNSYMGKCYEFNNKGKCLLPFCRYLHKCIRCNYAHPAINCKVPSVRNSNMGTRNNFINFDRTSPRNNTAGRQNVGRQLSDNRFAETGRYSSQN